MPVLTGRRVYRVCRARYARLDGAGALLVGGRWNSSGRAVVYMAESIALAVLENLVHMTRQDFPAAVLPDGISMLHEKDLRKHAALEDLSTQQLGDWWLDSRTSAVLQVPSFVIVGEHNFLLNPAHSEFARIQVEPPAIFHFDVRLFGGS
ncbi:MAG: RES family NAD+ phosphorylase [Bryobacteraceae bacterium]